MSKHTPIDVIEYAEILAQDIRGDYGATVKTEAFDSGRSGVACVQVHITTDSRDFRLTLRSDGRGECSEGSTVIGGPDLDVMKAEAGRRVRAELSLGRKVPPGGV